MLSLSLMQIGLQLENKKMEKRIRLSTLRVQCQIAIEGETIMKSWYVSEQAKNIALKKRLEDDQNPSADQKEDLAVTTPITHRPSKRRGTIDLTWGSWKGFTADG